LIALAIITISFLGCGDDEEENLPEVIAGFTQTVNEETGTVTFLNTSEEATKYVWVFGDGETSTEINPIKTYKTGTYTVKLTASNGAGASDVFEDEITIFIPLVMTLPISFDDSKTSYKASVFDGASFEVVNNPDVSGSNASASKVGAITNIGAVSEGISFDLGAEIKLITEKSISMNFWSDIAVDVLLRLEEGTGEALEATVSHGGTGWEATTFNFNSSNQYSKLTLFVDGPGTISGTFYIDNIMQAATVDSTPPVITLIDEAEINQTVGVAFVDPGATAEDNIDGDISGNIVVGGDDVDINTIGAYEITYNVSDAGGNAAVEATRTVNIVDSTIDTTPPLIELVGEPTINLTVGDSYLDQGATATDNVDATVTVIPAGVVDTDTPDTYTVTYNASDEAGNAATEVTRTVIVSPAPSLNLLVNGDFETGSAAPWDGNPISSDPDIRTEGGNSYFFANLTATGTNQFDVNLYQELEITQGSTYTLTFEASTGAGTTRTIIAALGLNEEPYAGVERVINLTENTQTFTQTFTAVAFGSAKSRVFFDLAAATGVVVIDNVTLVLDSSSGGGGGGGSSGELATNGDFEDGNKTGWIEFPNGGTFTVTDTEAQGGTFSGQLVAGEGTDIVIKQANLASGTIGKNVSVTITFDMKGTLAGDGGVVFAEFFSEISPEGVSKSEIFTGAPLTVNSDWTAFSFTTTTDAANVSGGVTLQLKAACGPVAGCSVEAFFDNVTVTIDE
jgi:hypothetical protein